MMDNKTKRRLEVLSRHINNVQQQPLQQVPCAKKRNIVPLKSVVENDSKDMSKNLVREREKIIKWNGWGFRDTEFLMREDGMCYVNGQRYIISGKELPGFRDYFEKHAGVDVEYASPPQKLEDMLKKIPKPVICQEFLDELEREKPYKYKTFDPEARLLHSHGHSCQEIYQLRWGKFVRLVDIVIYPGCHEHVEKIVQLAQKYPVMIIPYGGGTTVSQALMVPEEEERMVISLDMQEMNNIKWIDFENNLACIEAGAVGWDIDNKLKAHGLCLGHEPDSYEFSTLGGWISTRASGMKKNVYGNIEDFVVRIKFVTAIGTIDCKVNAERKSTGPDLHELILGHEGTLGVVTEAVCRVHKLPEVQKWGSVVFPDFETGVACVNEISNKKLAPASIRLMDNLMFLFGQSLKVKTDSKFELFVDWLKKIYLTKFCGLDLNKVTVVTLLFEGDKDTVELQEKKLYEICSKYGGIKAGEDAGKQGYMLTYVIAYLRDYAMAYYFIAESFETTVPWKNVVKCCYNVKKRIEEAGKKRNTPTIPWVCYRVTQTYRTGACIYFYFGFVFRGLENPVKVFSEIEAEARDEILANGGTLSHHHGIGKLRKHWSKQAMGETGFEILKKIKNAIDPKNTFGNGNMGLTPATISVSSKLIE